MGQAVVALPDPLDAPPPTMSGTDDLLAQLAGDEIDRLLAESDDDRAAFNAASRPATSDAAELPATIPPAELTVPQATAELASADSTQSTAAAQQSVPPAPVQAAPSPIAAPASVPDVTAALEMDAELGALLNQLNQSGEDIESSPAVPATPAPVVPVVEAPKTLTEQVPGLLAQFEGQPVTSPAVAVSGPALPSSEVAPDAVMSPAERDALSLSNLADETDVAEREDAVAAAAALEAATPPRIRLMIRLLEGLNAPLAFVPDAARDLLGKAAILTLVNSLAVLIYVLFVRR